MNPRVYLIFPPGWTLVTGSPHLAVPLLSRFLQLHGIEVVKRDLNFEAVNRLNINLHADQAEKACAELTLDSMNHPYFDAEDRLMKMALAYEGEWNAQLGFSYTSGAEKSSKQSLAASIERSPFAGLFADVVSDILRDEPHLVGFCIASIYQIIPALQLSKALRSHNYRGLIVLGGNTVSRLRKEMALPQVFDLIDSLISFQGEEALLQLCWSAATGNDVNQIPQLTWRDNTGVIRVNEGVLSPDLEAVGTPDFEGLAVGEYWGENYLTLIAARGCYYGRCDFCAIPYGWGNNGYSGTRSAERIFQDMLMLMDRFGIKRFKFVDEALSPNFMRSLAHQIIADNVTLEWEGYVRLENCWYDEAFVRSLSRAGFRKGYFGLELLPSTNRKLLSKNDHAKPRTLLERCSDAGIKPHLFCMFGYPGTGEPEADQTFEFLLRYQDLIDTADIFPWTYAKHTTIPGVERIVKASQDWALEYDHLSDRKDVLSSSAVLDLASRYEESLWREVPRLLHPTYRLVSPWSTVTRMGARAA